MTSTPNILLPYLATGGQASAEITHNDSLNRLDALVQLAFISRTTMAQPGSPTNGDLYLLPASGLSGADWPGHEDELAFYYDGWIFFPPNEGFFGWVNDENVLIVYDGAGWSTLVLLRSWGNTASGSNLASTSEELAATVPLDGASFVVGTLIRMRFAADYPTGGGGNSTWRVRVGGLAGQLLYDSGAYAAATDDKAVGEFDFVVAATGASGFMQGGGKVALGAQGAAASVRSDGGINGSAVSFTSTVNLVLTHQWSAAAQQAQVLHAAATQKNNLVALTLA